MRASVCRHSDRRDERNNFSARRRQSTAKRNNIIIRLSRRRARVRKKIIVVRTRARSLRCIALSPIIFNYTANARVPAIMDYIRIE